MLCSGKAWLAEWGAQVEGRGGPGLSAVLLLWGGSMCWTPGPMGWVGWEGSSWGYHCRVGAPGHTTGVLRALQPEQALRQAWLGRGGERLAKKVH
jgi:hypothetical protein